jgi:hypothetical protein
MVFVMWRVLQNKGGVYHLAVKVYVTMQTGYGHWPRREGNVKTM